MSNKSAMVAVFCLLTLVAVCSEALAADVTGVWRYEGLPDSEVTIAQDGSLIYLCVHHGLAGSAGGPAAIIGYAVGIIDGNKIKAQFKVVRRPNSTWGGSNGVTYQDLTVSPGGTTITGTWRNDSGSGATAKLIRVY